MESLRSAWLFPHPQDADFRNLVDGAQKKRKKDPLAPKRPLSAYNLFFKEKRLQLVGEEEHKGFEALGR